MTLATQTAWIVNASPFIGLAKIGRLALLAGPGRTVLMPESVAREIEAGMENDAARTALAQIRSPQTNTLGVVILPRVAPNPRLAAFRLDAGEESVLSEALARADSLCVIDDRPGRTAGKVLGLDVTGTLGVLLQAVDGGRLTLLAPELRALQAAGLYLPQDDVLRGLLAGLGEPWP